MPPARSNSQIAARPFSCSMPCSATLLFEPTDTYSLLPSGLATRPLVQWWFNGPPGRSATFVDGPSILVAPGLYSKRTSASVLATNSSLPTSAMPNGEFRFSRKTDFTSALPSPSASRSRVMRLALGGAAPALAITLPMILPRTPSRSSRSGRFGAFVSATSTSPFGNTYSQRG